MMGRETKDAPGAVPQPLFATTHWSVVLAATDRETPEAVAALEQLCGTYWYPLYAFVRRQGHSAQDGEDLLVGFFARFLEKHYLDDVDQAKGRFRSFLLAAFKHYLANEWDKVKAVRRGGRVEFLSLESEAAESRYWEEPASELTPEKLYEQRWACALLERVMERLQHDFDASGKAPAFEASAESAPDGPAAATPPEPASADSSARRLGDYELLEKIATGGMGVVYKARQLSLNRIVALKMIPPGRLASDESVLRFQAEAEAAASLQHPHIVAIHETGQWEDQHYFSMDYVAGENLADAVRSQPMPPVRAAQVVKAIAEAVHYAHQKGILHRDLKPSNIILDEAGEPHVTDFFILHSSFCPRLGAGLSSQQPPNAQEAFSVFGIPVHAPASMLVR